MLKYVGRKVGNKKAKKRKSPQYIGQTKASRAVFAYFDVPKKFMPLKWYTVRNFFGDGGGGGGGGRNIFVALKKILGLVGHNPKKSGKFLSAPLIFSFPYAHAS
jgi:hypothetical protein